MWTVINGFDRTDVIPFETIAASQMAGDQLPSCTFDIVDTSCTLSFDVGQEVIIFNEAAPPTKTFGGTSIPTTPAHNLAVGIPNGTYWKTSGTLGSLITPSGVNYQMVFSNSTNSSSGFIQFQTFYGYIHPGQQYMFSVYCTIGTPLVGANAILQIEFLDSGGNVLSGTVTTTFSSTVGNTQQHISIQGTAPTNAVYILAQMGGQTTSATNSGTVVFGSPQLEPMWFTARGISYPTVDCNAAQVNSALMPDLTISRMCRLFAGYINDLQITYDDNYAAGPNRTWHVTCAGYGAILENATFTGAFDSQTDAQIIQSVFANYSSWVNVTNAANTSSPSPIITGITVDAISFNENTLRDVLNSLTALSGFLYYFDYYGTLYYLPAYYSAASFVLTDAQPDNVTSFSYYEYQLEKDATQQKWDVIVIGGKFLAGAIQDSFTGDGSTTVFTLAQQPHNIHQTTVAGSLIKVGVSKRDKFTGGVTALYNKAKKTLTFQTAPANGASILIQYTYEAPIVVECIDDSVNKPVSPAYALPPFISKIHDTNLTSNAAATTRGLVELTNLSKPLVTITCKAQQFASVGQIIYFTASLDGILNQPYVVQEVDSSYLGNGINEFNYTLGYYRPTFTDHSRHIHKATVRSTTTAAVDVVLQTDLVIAETTAYSEVVTATPIGNTAPVLIWGTGKYGVNAYGAYQPTVLADAPIRFYRLKETSGTTANDLGSQALNGTINGTVTLNQASLILNDATGRSMLLDGSTGYITAATTGLPTGASPWTIEAWINMPTVPHSGLHSIVEFGNPASGQAAALFIDASGNICVNTYISNKITGLTAANGTTYHCVASYDGAKLHLYINGNEQASALLCTPAISLTYCYIGTEDSPRDDFYGGYVQEVALYSSALSLARIQAHYAMGTA